MLATRGLSILIGMVFVILMARWLGSEDYGHYFFIITLANFLALPVLAGLPTLIVREIAQARGRGDYAPISGIMRWSMNFVVISSSGIGLIGAVVFVFTRAPGDPLPSYALALPMIMALGAMQLAAAYLQGLEHPVLGNLPDGLIRPGTLLVMAVGLSALGVLTPEVGVLAHIAAAALAAGWAVIVGRRVRRTAFATLAPTQPRFETRAWLTGLLPLTLIVGAALLNNRLDVLMLGWLTDLSEVGRYGIALQIMGIVAIGPTIMNSIVQPRIARLYASEDRHSLQREATRAARLGLGLAILALAAIALLSEPIVLRLIGEDFRGAIPALLVLGTGRVLIASMGPVGTALNMTGNARVTALLALLFSVVNAALNWVLIPLYGASGAAWATTFSLIALHLVMTWQTRHLVGIDTSVIGASPSRG